MSYDTESSVRATRVSIWSVFRMSFLTSLIFAVGMTIAMVLLFVIAQSLGYIDSVANGISDLLGVTIEFTVGQALLVALVISGVFISWFVLTSLFLAAVFNLSSTLTGGLVFLTTPQPMPWRRPKKERTTVEVVPPKAITASPHNPYVRKPKLRAKVKGTS